jgi:hypothetical protein
MKTENLKGIGFIRIRISAAYTSISSLTEDFLVEIFSCGRDRKPLIILNTLHICWNVARKHFQYFLQHRVVDNVFVDGFGDIMYKLNVNLLCIHVAL